MKIAESYRRADLDDRYNVIVVGSGMGGLSAAALLARHGGRRVLVLERHYTPGGFTHVFRRPGYEWDVGVHYIGDVQRGTMLRALFNDITDGRLDWADMGQVYDRIVLGEERFDLPAGREPLRRRLKERFPAESDAIDAYLALVRQVEADTRRFFMEKALPAPVAALTGPLLRRRFLRHARRTTREVLESLTSDSRLIGLLTAQWGDFGLPPGQSSFGIHAMVVGHYMEGGFYPVGGAGRIAETVVPVIAEAGGRVLIRADVSEIVVEAGRAVGVRMAADGAVLRAPVIVSDAGVRNTFRRLLPHETAVQSGVVDHLEGLRPSIAHLCLYVGLDRTADALGLPRANLWIHPHEDHDATFAAMRRGDESPSFTFISFPSAKDPDFERRHPGRATIDIVSGMPYESFARWEGTRWKKRGEEYDALKSRLADRLLEVLYEHVPQTRGRIDTWELSTPLTTRHFCNHPRGEIYGLAHTPRRFEQRWLRPRTPVPGLYLTGQDTATCGVAGALIGGALSASAILGKNLLGRIAAASRAPPGLGSGETPAGVRCSELSGADPSYIHATRKPAPSRA